MHDHQIQNLANNLLADHLTSWVDRTDILSQERISSMDEITRNRVLLLLDRTRNRLINRLREEQKTDVAKLMKRVQKKADTAADKADRQKERLQARAVKLGITTEDLTPVAEEADAS